MPGDGLPEAVVRRVHARGAERAAAAAGGGAGALLGAGEDQQRARRLRRRRRAGQGAGRGRAAADAAAASGRDAAVVPGRVGGGEEGHQHAQVRAGERQGQVPGAAARDGRAPEAGGARRRAVARGGAPSPAAGAGAKAGGTGKSQGPSAWSSGWRKLGRLAKMTGADAAGPDGHVVGAPGEAPRKPRRWRNSIS